MPQLEQVVSEQAVVYRPKKRDSAGRDEQQARAMDLPPRSGSAALVPGGKEQIALGGNAPQPPPISQVDQQYAAGVAETYEEYPRVMYHKAFKRERDAAGKVVPGGEVFPLRTADAISPNYPVPLNIAERNGVKGTLSTSEGTPAIIGQHLYKTCFVPLDWNPEHQQPIDKALCQKQEAELLKAGWVRSPNELDLPKPKRLEEESDD
jgi:hypothetical protein